MKLHETVIVRTLPTCFLLGFFITTTLSIVESRVPERDSDADDDDAAAADFKVSNEFFGEEDKSSPVVATPNLILMMVKAASDANITVSDRKQKKNDDEETTKSVAPKDDEWRMDRFYYCGPKNGDNSCRSLCYSFGYPRIECGRVSCYCTW